MGHGGVNRLSLLLAACLCTGLPAAAQPADPARAAVLPIQTRELPADTAAAYRACVEAVLGDISVLTLLDPKIVEERIDTLSKEHVYDAGCIEQMECVKRTGERLQADVLIHLEADKSIDGVKFTIRSFDTGTGSLLEKEAGFSDPGSEETEQVLRRLTLKSLATVIKERSKSTGKLMVESPQKDAELLINNKPFGKMVGKRFTVAAGVFEVLVRREGFVPFHDVVLVEPGKVKVVEADLQPENLAADTPTGPVAAADPIGKPGGKEPAGGTAPYLPGKEKKKTPPPVQEEDTPFYKSWWFWSLVGAGVATAGGTTAYFLLRDEGPTGQGRLEVNWQ